MSSCRLIASRVAAFSVARLFRNSGPESVFIAFNHAPDQGSNARAKETGGLAVTNTTRGFSGRSTLLCVGSEARQYGTRRQLQWHVRRPPVPEVLEGSASRKIVLLM